MLFSSNYIFPSVKENKRLKVKMLNPYCTGYVKTRVNAYLLFEYVDFSWFRMQLIFYA